VRGKLKRSLVSGSSQFFAQFPKPLLIILIAGAAGDDLVLPWFQVFAGERLRIFGRRKPNPELHTFFQRSKRGLKKPDHDGEGDFPDPFLHFS
jgi:hypothetical protein